MVSSEQAVAVVVLTYRSPLGVLEDAVGALLAEPGPRPIVIDNGDEARDRLAGRRVDVVRSDHNGGYAAGMNLGLRRAFAAGATHVALLNDDVIVEPGWLDAALCGFDGDDVGAVQPLLLDRDGVVVSSAGVVIDRAGQGSDAGIGEPIETYGEATRAIDAFTGGAVVLSRTFLDDVGLFDERFFLYYEDVELSRRGRRAGWSYRLAAASRVRHLGSATTSGLGDRARMLQERNRLWCSCMTGGSSEVMAGSWLSVRRLRHPPRAVHLEALARGTAGGVVRLARRAGRRIGRRSRSVSGR